MTKTIKKIGVIGAGTMGTGIAAQAANAGLEVVLLDKFEGKAEAEIQRMLQAKPTDAFNAGLMHPDNAKRIQTGTIDNNIDLLADCDWIVESVLVPNPQIRQDLYKAVQKVARPDAIFSSNTSMDTTGDITYDQDDDFKKRFLNTHFFNPVRFMHLLEVIPSEVTDPEIVAAISEVGDKVLGKKVVLCKDERGFIANRIGMYIMERAKHEALAQDVKIEDVDALMGKAFGFPHLGLFRLGDEVGLDVVEHVRSDLHAHLPQEDDFQRFYTGDTDLAAMLKDGYVGNRKANSKGGYYRLKKDESGQVIRDAKGKPVKQALDLQTRTYRDAVESPHAHFEKQIGKLGGYRGFFNSDHAGARYVWPVMRDTMLYVMEHAQTLAHDIQAVDDAMRGGYNWELGPFQLMDKFGIDWFKGKLEAEGIPIPPLLDKVQETFYRVENRTLKVMGFDGSYEPVRREEGIVNLEDIKLKSKPLVTHHSASLWDIGDGVTCLEFHSQHNSVDPSILWVMNESIKLMKTRSDLYKAMVIYNDAPRFSVGANLKLAEVFMNVADNKYAKMFGLAGYAEKGLKGMLHELIYQGQSVYTALHQAPFPVIGAPKGTAQNMALGGGCEVLLNCDAIQSGPEQVMALPEIGIGILPAWTGSTRYLERCFDAAKAGQGAKGPMAPVIRAATALSSPMSSLATNAQDAKAKLWLKPTDGVTLNPDRVLADAKAKALAMVPDYKPQALPVFALPGITGKGAIRMNVDKMYNMGGSAKTGINHVDVQAADRLADVLTGGEHLDRQDIEEHAARHHDHLHQLMDEKGQDYLDVNQGIMLNYSRMMQLERDRILDGFNDKAQVWPRVRYTLANNTYLREDRPEPAPSLATLREQMMHQDLPRRSVDGEPLTGENAERLKAMADMTSEFYGQMRARKTWDLIKQTPKTLCAIGRVFKMV